MTVAPDNLMAIASEKHRIWRPTKSHSQNARCLKPLNFELTLSVPLYNKQRLSSQNTLIQKALPCRCPVWAFSSYRDISTKNMCLLWSIWCPTWCLSGQMWFILNPKSEAEQQCGGDEEQRVRRKRIRTDILCLLKKLTFWKYHCVHLKY